MPDVLANSSPLRRRFTRGWANFTHHYRLFVDAWTIYDNSGSRPVELETGP